MKFILEQNLIRQNKFMYLLTAEHMKLMQKTQLEVYVKLDTLELISLQNLRLIVNSFMKMKEVWL